MSIDDSVRQAAGIINDIIEVSAGRLQKLSSPGKCEAIAISPGGALVACFHNLGVYELGAVWELRFKTPYPASEGEHWDHMAQSQREIALSVSPVPRLVGDKTVYDSWAALWPFDGKRLERAMFSIE